MEGEQWVCYGCGNVWKTSKAPHVKATRAPRIICACHVWATRPFAGSQSNRGLSKAEQQQPRRLSAPRRIAEGLAIPSRQPDSRRAFSRRRRRSKLLLRPGKLWPKRGWPASEAKAGSLLTRRNMQTRRSAAQVQPDGGPILGIPSGPDRHLRA